MYKKAGNIGQVIVTKERWVSMNVRLTGKQAFDTTYESDLDYVASYSVLLHGSHYQAEEIIQCVFINLCDDIDNVNVQSVPAWLITNRKEYGIRTIIRD